ncbi:MAG: STAS domain-containing protein [Fibrobacter sp.]|nr:STAS domain-containing protein [Fibrobacter sp.]
MMEVLKKNENGKLLVQIIGEMDAITAPKVEEAIGSLEGVSELVLDLAQVPYLSSAGIRAILTTRMRFGKNDKFSIVNIQPMVKEILDMTGTSKILGLK